MFSNSTLIQNNIPIYDKNNEFINKRLHEGIDVKPKHDLNVSKLVGKEIELPTGVGGEQ